MVIPVVVMQPIRFKRPSVRYALVYRVKLIMCNWEKVPGVVPEFFCISLCLPAALVSFICCTLPWPYLKPKLSILCEVSWILSDIWLYVIAAVAISKFIKMEYKTMLMSFYWLFSSLWLHDLGSQLYHGRNKICDWFLISAPVMHTL